MTIGVLAAMAPLRIVAWGNLVPDVLDASKILMALSLNRVVDLHAFGITKDGKPKHPMARGHHRIADDATLSCGKPRAPLRLGDAPMPTADRSSLARREEVGRVLRDLIDAGYFAGRTEDVARYRPLLRPRKPPRPHGVDRTGGPEGYRLVPIKPTPQMVNATWHEPLYCIESDNTRNKRIYAAMVAAAPTPPAPAPAPAVAPDSGRGWKSAADPSSSERRHETARRR